MAAESVRRWLNPNAHMASALQRMLSLIASIDAASEVAVRALCCERSLIRFVS
ncbi:hypothetical protein DOTSEDRAFT_47523 [Dothistroma septosporum NZE10]|uniref:Uncharacterized protein n=1 Tax=Dothistroma septosporum (strain NZE10 / CBS 128990) TaxID=675120 RepID=N1PD82_DOTSN|nr:hypothetical protein DOTSEDRAFT_47523 [Dothistroma septosporum NZE10]